MAIEQANLYPSHIPGRACCWQLKTRQLELPLRPRLMGIINVTPDSFSDGGRFLEPVRAVEQALQLVAAGADLLDIGGESASPYAEPVAADEELAACCRSCKPWPKQRRCRFRSTPGKPLYTARAVAAGAEIINDITGLTGDPNMVRVALDTQAAVCAMHMRGTPQTMQDEPRYEDVVREVGQYLRERRNALVAAGMERSAFALDPGIGFGKTHQHNLDLMAGCRTLHELGQPVLVGHSRKGFIAKVIHDKKADRTAGTIGAALSLAQQGVQIIRVHDVGPVRQRSCFSRPPAGSTAAASRSRINRVQPGRAADCGRPTPRRRLLLAKHGLGRYTQFDIWRPVCPATESATAGCVYVFCADAAANSRPRHYKKQLVRPP